MSYLVCHVQKFKMSDVRGMQIHNQRESENSKNTDIDRSKSSLNYDLHNKNDVNYLHKTKEIIQEGYTGSKAIRKDAVVMTSTLISSDKEFFERLSPNGQQKFFQNAYDKLKELYGEKNILSAVVHMDEHTPHMHVCSVPLTGEGKLSAKDIFNREGLRSLQDELPRHLQSSGFDIERGETSDKKHVDTYEHKKQQAKELEQKVDKDINRLQTQLKELQGTKTTISRLEHLEAKKSLIGGKVTLSENDYELVLGMAKQGVLKSKELEEVKKEKERLKDENKDLRQGAQKAVEGVKGIIQENGKLKEKVKSLREQGKVMHETLKENGFLDVAKEKMAAIREEEKAAAAPVKKMKPLEMEME